MRVPEIMQTDVGHHVAGDELIEGAGKPFGVDGPPIGPAEDETVVLPGGTDEEPFLGLPSPP